MQLDGYTPDAIDAAYIEATAAPIHPVFEAMEAAAWAVEPRVPILDRAAARVLGVLATGRPRIVEVGTAFGYSTLWMALAQPPGGRIVTIDPDTSRTARARAWWRDAGVSDEQITVISRPAMEAFGSDEPALRGPFDLAFIDALKHEYAAYLAALRPRLAPHALVAVDNVLWSGRVAGEVATDGQTAALRDFNAAVLGDPHWRATILPVGDGLLLATPL
ncbi:MAG TPA: O-methyltransferase [Candidatus Sulfotelmatobacter sp.]|nr:O-methyltransferase [Candidatus Sulfotelmatobacter sp.]